MDLGEVFFGSPSLRKNYAIEIREIEQGCRRAPDPDPPASIEGESRPFLSEDDRVVFAEFERFGTVLSDLLGHGPWQVDDLPSVDIGGYGGPAWGRNYAVFYNNVRAGKIKVGADSIWKLAKADAPPVAYCDITLELVQFMPFEQVADFLHNVSYLVSDDIPDMAGKVRSEVQYAMTRHLWNAMAQPDVALSLHHRVQGTFGFYQHRRDLGIG